MAVDFEHVANLDLLRRRESLTSKVFKTLTTAISVSGLIYGGLIIYNQHRVGKLTKEFGAVIDSAHKSIAANKVSLDSVNVLQLKYEHELAKLVANRIELGDSAVAYAVRTVAPKLDPCGTPVIENAGIYSAEKTRCELSVTIPAGGSISGASRAYFGDAKYWEEFTSYSSNADLSNPNLIEPGTVYRFNLR